MHYYYKFKELEVVDLSKTKHRAIVSTLDWKLNDIEIEWG